MSIDDLNKATQHPLVQSGQRVVMYDEAGRIQIAPVSDVNQWAHLGYTLYQPGPAPEPLKPVETGTPAQPKRGRKQKSDTDV